MVRLEPKTIDLFLSVAGVRRLPGDSGHTMGFIVRWAAGGEVELVPTVGQTRHLGEVGYAVNLQWMSQLSCRRSAW